MEEREAEALDLVTPVVQRLSLISWGALSPADAQDGSDVVLNKYLPFALQVRAPCCRGSTVRERLARPSGEAFIPYALRPTTASLRAHFWVPRVP